MSLCASGTPCSAPRHCCVPSSRSAAAACASAASRSTLTKALTVGLCSSMASLVGGFGQVDYCSANAYLDTFARAFTREMSMLRPRAFGGLAELTVAHAVLSDDERRRAYDREIGIAPEPEPAPKPALPLHTHGAGSASFARAGLSLAAPVDRPAIALAVSPGFQIQSRLSDDA